MGVQRQDSSPDSSHDPSTLESYKTQRNGHTITLPGAYPTSSSPMYHWDDSSNTSRHTSTSSLRLRQSPTKEYASPLVSPKVLPPTPPSAIYDSSGSDGAISSSSRRRRTTKNHNSHISTGADTPLHGHSPPTPEITPPRENNLRPDLSQIRLGSSRADSFKTARETQSSDEEVPSLPRLMTAREHRPARERFRPLSQSGTELHESSAPVSKPFTTTTGRRKSLRHSGSFEDLVLLGKQQSPKSNFAGWQQANDGRSDSQESLAIHKTDVRRSLRHSGSFEDLVQHGRKQSPKTNSGDWDEANNEVDNSSSPRWDAAAMGNVTLRQKNHQTNTRHVSQPLQAASPRFEAEHVPFSRGRSSSLRERIKRDRENRDSFADKLATERFARAIAWPENVEDGDSDSLAPAKRLSSFMSMDVIIVDEAPSPRRTLRHSSKQIQLKVPQPSPEPRKVDTIPVETMRGRSKLHDSRHAGYRHKSSASSSTRSFRSRPPSMHIEQIDVVIVPQRSSSLSAHTSTENSRRSSMFTTASLQAQMNTSDDNLFNRPARHKRRTLSESVASIYKTQQHGLSSSGSYFPAYPTIPARSSSLSAPTSRNVSRSNSVTETQRSRQSSRSQQIPKPLASPILLTTSPRKSNENELSAPLTPYAMTHDTSRTPEVHEATAVSLFPHNNRSLLVVQSNSRPETREKQSSSSSLSPVDRGADFADSPLKNPRKPPEPPVFKFVSPTPASTFVEENPRHSLKRSLTDGARTGSGPIGLIRRTFSTHRRYSFSSPVTGNPPEGMTSDATQTDGPASAHDRDYDIFRRPSLGRQDSRLHAFWRPRAFWDGIDDDEEDFGDLGFGDTPRRRSHRLSFAGIRRNKSQRNEAPERAFSPVHYTIAPGGVVMKRSKSTGSLRRVGSFSDSAGQRIPRSHKVPGLDLHVQYIGIRGVQDMIRKTRERRVARNTEKRKKTMRSTISHPVPIEGNAA
jgi:hypothetical protein